MSMPRPDFEAFPTPAGNRNESAGGAGMNVDRGVFAFAGLVVLAGLALGLTVSPWWFALTAFAGLNMFQAAFTGFCPAAAVMKRLGLRPGAAFD
jgi:hypothetical protein